MNLEKIIQKSFDLHVHIGPEIIPRKYNLESLIKSEAGKLAGIGVKNHFFPTPAMWRSSPEIKIIYGLVLNNYQGGLNVDLIQASAQLINLPLIVWLPTLHTQEFLRANVEEIPREWLDESVRHNLELRKTKNIRPINVIDKNNNLLPEMTEVLKAIKQTGSILATGHISWRESEIIVREAIEKYGLNKIIITHPIYQKINMPLEKQKMLAQLGAYIEHCYSMHTVDGIPVEKIAQQIKYVGAEKCILSSDVGQKFSPSPSDALLIFSKLLLKAGLNEGELETMLIDNPSRLINNRV